MDEDISSLLDLRVCDLGLRIEGGPLEPAVNRVRGEFIASGLTRLRPVFYLSNEWGVNLDTIAVGIPFYLADDRLRLLYASRGGLIEGIDQDDILRYLRHELGHVVNYAYRLHETADWRSLFGVMTVEYPEEYSVVPFQSRYVRHLPGQYAQIDADEDWAETFAVWLNPQSDWRELYRDAPLILGKLEYCERAVAGLRERDPEVTDAELDADVGEIEDTVEEFFADELPVASLPNSVDADLRALLSPHTPTTAGAQPVVREPAAPFLRRHRDHLAAAVYRWTGVFPEKIQPLLVYLEQRAERLDLTYLATERDEVLADLASFVTTLAMNYTQRRTFMD